MVHLDSHPDLLIPVKMSADTVYDKEKLFRCCWAQSFSLISLFWHILTVKTKVQIKKTTTGQQLDIHATLLMGTVQQLED